MDVTKKPGSANAPTPSTAVADRRAGRLGVSFGATAASGDLLATFDSIFDSMAPPADAVNAEPSVLKPPQPQRQFQSDDRDEKNEEDADAGGAAQTPRLTVSTEILSKPEEASIVQPAATLEQPAPVPPVQDADERLGRDAAQREKSEDQTPLDERSAGPATSETAVPVVPLEEAVAEPTVAQRADPTGEQRGEPSGDTATQLMKPAAGNEAANPDRGERAGGGEPQPTLLTSTSTTPEGPAEQGQGVGRQLPADDAGDAVAVVDAGEATANDSSSRDGAREARLERQGDPREAPSDAAHTGRGHAASERGDGSAEGNPLMSEMHAVEPYALPTEAAPAAGLGDTAGAMPTAGGEAVANATAAAATGGSVAKQAAADSATRTSEAEAVPSAEGPGDNKRGTRAERATGENRTTGTSNDARVRLVQRVARAFQRLGPDGGRVHIMLHPAELGSVRLDLTVDGNHMDASMRCESEAALEVMRQHLPELRQRLADSGLVVDRIEVELAERFETGSESADQRREQHGQRPSGATSKISPAGDPAGGSASSAVQPRPAGNAIRGQRSLDLVG